MMKLFAAVGFVLFVAFSNAQPGDSRFSPEMLVYSKGWSQPDSSRYNRYQNNDDLEDRSFWNKCYVGGDFGFYGGTGQLYVNVSPLLGYRPENKGFSFGAGITYQYTYFNDVLYGKYSYSLFGVRAFIRQQLGEHFFIHGEYENYMTKGMNVFTQKMENIVIPCASAFLGFKQHFSEFSYYYIMLGYEFIGDPYTRRYVYNTQPLVFKVGYIFDIKKK